MDYRKHYNALILRAQNRSLSGYSEKHHIVPKCMGGENDKTNIVRLTASEHYLAHQLLIKIYPDCKGLIVAAVRMAKQCTGNKAYSWLRKRHSESMKLSMKGNPYGLGRIRPQEEKDRISLAMKGVPKSKETKKLMAEAQKGNKHALGLVRGPMSDEHKANLKAALKGRKPPLLDENARAKISAARIAYWQKKRQEKGIVNDTTN